MKRTIIISVLTILFLSGGCANKISPLSPDLKQQLNNTNGEIEELKNNQNGLQLELGKIRNQSDMNAQEIKDAQQGILNIKGSQNSGIEIFSGDGGFVMLIALAMMGFMFLYHYRDRAIKSEKTADILAQQIALHDDPDLDNKVFMSALNSDVESNIYHIMVKQQNLVGKPRT